MQLKVTFNDKNAQKIFGGEHDTHLLFFLDTEKHGEDNKKTLENFQRPRVYW